MLLAAGPGALVGIRAGELMARGGPHDRVAEVRQLREHQQDRGHDTEAENRPAERPRRPQTSRRSARETAVSGPDPSAILASRFAYRSAVLRLSQRNLRRRPESSPEKW